MNSNLSQVDRYTYKKIDPRKLGAAADEVERIRQKLGSWQQLFFRSRASLPISPASSRRWIIGKRNLGSNPHRQLQDPNEVLA